MQHAGTTPKNPHQKWQFAVELGGFDAAFFTRCSPIDVDNDVSRFAPGGSIADQKTAGRSVFNAVTLEKGKSQEGTDNSIIQWQKAILQAAQGTGGMPSDYMRQLDVVEYDRTGVEIRRYRLYGAFISKARFGEYDGSSSDPTIEELTVEYQYFDQVL